jgi:hypothetical protein
MTVAIHDNIEIFAMLSSILGAVAARSTVVDPRMRKFDGRLPTLLAKEMRVAPMNY